MKRLFLAGFSLIFLFFITTSLLFLTREMPPPNKEFENHPGEEELTSRANTAWSIATARGDTIGQAINHPSVTITRVLLSRYLEVYRLDPLFFPDSRSSYPLPGIGLVPFIVLPFFVLGAFLMLGLQSRMQKLIILTVVLLAPIPGIVFPWSAAALLPVLFVMYGLAARTVWSIVGDALKHRDWIAYFFLAVFFLNVLYIVHQWMYHQ
ncbi:MAG: hypothetical protein Q8R11_01885 [bacterium]|nr:hypothetical protein [bacterium]